LIKGPKMADVCIPAFPRAGVARAISRLIGIWRAFSAGARTIDPDALSDHLQRDLGFRDGRSTSATIARATADRARWR
jgi:hypothetical protein